MARKQQAAHMPTPASAHGRLSPTHQLLAGRAAPLGTDLQPLLDLTGRAKGADVVAVGFQVCM